MVFRDRPAANVDPGKRQQEAHLPAGRRYRLIQNLASIEEAISVQTDEGAVAFKIEQVPRALIDMLVLRDLDGSTRFFMSAVQSGPPGATEVLGVDGRPLARVSRTAISAVRDRFEVDLLSGDFWMVFGDVGSREFTLESTRGQVAEVSRRWFLLPHSYGVEVVTGHDDALVLAVTAAIDLLIYDAHP